MTIGTEYRAHPEHGLLIGSDGSVIGRRGSRLKPSVATGYEMVAVSTNGRVRHELVHRLVAEAYLTKTGTQVNHKDGDKRNNRVENLEWCDSSHNNRHALTTGLRDMRKIRGHKNSSGAKNPRAKLTEEQVREIRELRYSYGDSPWRMYGISNAQFYSVRNRKTWKEVV